VVSFFKGKAPGGVFRLVILSVAVHFSFFFAPPKIVVPPQDYLLYWLLSPMADIPPVFIAIIYHILVIVQALRINYLVSNYRMFLNMNYTPAMCYIIFSALVPAWGNVSAALLVNIIIILLMDMLMKLYYSQHPVRIIFDCGFITGLSILIFPPVYILVLAALIAILILRSIKINEIIAYFIGIILPYYFLGGWLFLIGKLALLKNYLPVINWHFSLLNLDNKEYLLIAGIAILFCVLLGFLFMQDRMGLLIIAARKQWIIFTLSFLLLAISIPFVKNGNWIMALFAAMPAASTVAANVFYYAKPKVLIAVLFWLLLIACFFNNFNGMSLLQQYFFH
jgi:hypothetical protein